MTKQITLGSLFDGIGGFPYAASFYRIKTVWASEILPCAISVTRRHFPDMIHAGDLTKLSGELLPPVDIISFGSPCQDLSVAKGHRDGLSGERSGLFTEAIRIIKEMRKSTNGKYPRFAVWENVPGALHSRNGSDYKTVLEAFTDCEISMPPSGRWATAGMVRSADVDLAWCVYNAAEFGLAQRRKRVFLVADFGGTSAGKILFIPKGLPRHFAAGGTQGESIAAAIAGGIDGTNTNCLNPWDTQQKRVYTEDGTAPTLTGADGGGGRNPAGLVMAETEKCGINGNIAGTLDAHYGKGTGMRGGKERDIVLCAATGQSNAEIQDDLSPTLNCNCEQPIVYKPENAVFGETGRGYWQPGVQTIRATGENHPGSPSHVVAAFIGRASPGAGSIGYSETEAPTLRAGMTHHVCEEKKGIEILNDQGGASMSVEKDGHAPTLRHSTHGNLPVICVATTQADASINDNLCPTITAAAGMSGNNKPYIVHPQDDTAYGFDLQQITSKTNRSSLKPVQPSLCAAGNPHVVHPEKSGTLCGSAAGLSRPAGMASETELCVAYCLQGNMIGRSDENGPQGGGVNEEISFTLNATDRPAVVPINMQIATRHNALGEGTGLGVGKDGDPAYTLQEAHCHAVAVDCRNMTESETQSGTLQAKDSGGYSLNCTPSVRIGYTVRRLTPMECERLQGFPDGWTDSGISPEDYERYKKSIKRGIKRTGLPEDVVLQKISDSKRYQMLGNSVAIPCVAHIMRGIAEEMEETV